MNPGQDWCLQCGAGAPGSLGTPGWRSGATILLATLILAVAAAVAAYAALNKSTPKAQTVTTTVAQVTPPAATTPKTPTATTPGTAAVPKTVKPAVPLGKTTPPKIPLTATPTPRSSTTPNSTSPSTPSKTSTPTGGETGNSSESSESTELQPTAILLDTNAAQTYNPYDYPASEFGDPSLTIDGDSSTAWTAQVEAATAPKMAEGVLVNLKSGQKISKLKLITSTPGMTVQIYGVHGAKLPSSITDPAWITLSHSQVIKKRRATIKLRDSSRSFTYITLWISKAPATSTPEAPGHVSVNEIELFPTE
jgi:hypothetical protein